MTGSAATISRALVSSSEKGQGGNQRGKGGFPRACQCCRLPPLRYCGLTASAQRGARARNQKRPRNPLRRLNSSALRAELRGVPSSRREIFPTCAGQISVITTSTCRNFTSRTGISCRGSGKGSQPHRNLSSCLHLFLPTRILTYARDSHRSSGSQTGRVTRRTHGAGMMRSLCDRRGQSHGLIAWTPRSPVCCQTPMMGGLGEPRCRGGVFHG